MKTICNEVQQQLLQELKPSDQQQQHLRECADCRDFASLLHALPELEELVSEPSVELDGVILAAANRRSAPTRRPRLMLWLPMAAAAAIALVLTISIMLNQPTLPPGETVPRQDQSVALQSPDGANEALLDWEFSALDSGLLQVEASLTWLQEVVNSEYTLDAFAEEMNTGS